MIIIAPTLPKPVTTPSSGSSSGSSGTSGSSSSSSSSGSSSGSSGGYNGTGYATYAAWKNAQNDAAQAAYTEAGGSHINTTSEYAAAHAAIANSNSGSSSSSSGTASAARVPLTSEQVAQYNNLASQQASYVPLSQDEQGNYYYPVGSVKEQYQAQEAANLSMGYEMTSTTKSDIYKSPAPVTEGLFYNSNVGYLEADSIIARQQNTYSAYQDSSGGVFLPVEYFANAPAAPLNSSQLGELGFVNMGTATGPMSISILAPEGSPQYNTAKKIITAVPSGWGITQTSEGSYLVGPQIQKTETKTNPAAALAGPAASSPSIVGAKEGEIYAPIESFFSEKSSGVSFGPNADGTVNAFEIRSPDVAQVFIYSGGEKVPYTSMIAPTRIDTNLVTGESNATYDMGYAFKPTSGGAEPSETDLIKLNNVVNRQAGLRTQRTSAPPGKDTVFGLATFYEENFPYLFNDKTGARPAEIYTFESGREQMVGPPAYTGAMGAMGIFSEAVIEKYPLSAQQTAWATIAIGAVATAEVTAPGSVLSAGALTNAAIGGTISTGIGEGARIIFEPGHQAFSDVGAMGIDFGAGAVSTVAFLGVSGTLKPLVNLQPGLAGEFGKRVIVGGLSGGAAGYTYSASQDIFYDKAVDTNKATTYAAYGVLTGAVIETVAFGMDKGYVPHLSTVDKTWATKTYNEGIITTQEYSYRGVGVEWFHKGKPLVGVEGGGGWKFTLGQPNVYREGVTAYPMAFTPTETAIFEPAYGKYYNYLSTAPAGEKALIVEDLMNYAASQPKSEQQMIVDYFKPEKGGLGVASTRYGSGKELMFYTYSNQAPHRLEMSLQSVISESPLFQKEGAPEAVMNILKREKPIVYGSSAQKAQEGGAYYTRATMDIDLISPKPEGLASTIVSELKPIYGSSIRISPETPSLVEVNVGGNWVHAFDIHSSYGSAGGPLNNLYIGYGLATKPAFVTSEGYPMMTLQEQGTRKWSSVLSPQSFGPAPEAHRLKDVYGALSASDYFSITQGNTAAQATSQAFKNTIPMSVQTALEISASKTTAFAIYPSVYYSATSPAVSPLAIGIFAAAGKTSAPSTSIVSSPVKISSPSASPGYVSSFFSSFSSVSSPSKSSYSYSSISILSYSPSPYSPKISAPFSPSSVPHSPSPYSPSRSPPYSPPYSPPSKTPSFVPPYSPPSSPPYSPPSSPPYSPPSSPPYSPPSSPPNEPPFRMPFLDGMGLGFGKTNSHTGKQPKEYHSSIVGQLMGGSIAKTPSKTFTGGEVRLPVVKKSAKKKSKGGFGGGWF